MQIYPAIDLKNKKVVRLTQGDYNKVDVYAQDPAAVALSFAEAGAQYLHVVDLDGAKDGTLSNFAAVEQIVKATGMYVEIGGGIRDESRIQTYLNLGVGRVILGTAALKDFDFLTRMVETYKDKIVVGVDAKNGFVATQGWLELSEVDGISFCKKVHAVGVQHVIYTDIAKDGAMQGINLALYKQLKKEIPTLAITASGGVSSLSDIKALREINTKAAIVGKALYTGALTLQQVLKAGGEEA